MSWYITESVVKDDGKSVTRLFKQRNAVALKIWIRCDHWIGLICNSIHWDIPFHENKHERKCRGKEKSSGFVGSEDWGLADSVYLRLNGQYMATMGACITVHRRFRNILKTVRTFTQGVEVRNTAGVHR